MDLELKTWLFDILNSIDEIESYFEGQPKLFASYQNDLRTKRAIERNLEIIGEAMSRILKFSENIEIANSRKIVDVRNRIIHGYDSVSDEVIWGIVIKQLPLLKIEVESLLQSN
jgi:uncharacterized protein with HEPN domain